jgi:hypothetical protein
MSRIEIYTGLSRHFTARTARTVERIVERHRMVLDVGLHPGLGYFAHVVIPDRDMRGDPQDSDRLRAVLAEIRAAGVEPHRLRDEQLVLYRGRCRADHLRAMGHDPRQYRCAPAQH